MTQRPWESKEGGAWLRRRLAEDLGEGVFGAVYPSQAMRYELNALLKLTVKRKSRICESNGCVRAYVCVCVSVCVLIDSYMYVPTLDE